VGNFRQGMLVSVPLHLDSIAGQPTVADVQGALDTAYAGSEWVRVLSADEVKATGGKIAPEALNDTNRLELFVCGNEARRQAVLVARLDNLGKGASGAAVQSLRMMLGLKGSHQ
jgi:N-acetyl-gamma-glutamyl-phosphate reductase